VTKLKNNSAYRGEYDADILGSHVVKKGKLKVSTLAEARIHITYTFREL
jgi:hypothetical protein